jgi:hypothetical protein
MLNKTFSILGVMTLGCAIFGNTSLLAQTSGSRTLNNSATSLQTPLARNQAAVDAERVIVQQRLAQKSKAGAASHLVRGSSGNPGIQQADSTNQLIANGYRAYPPSCLSDPLPDTPTAPAYSIPMDLAEINPATKSYVVETVTISLWRVACSSSDAATSGYKSATLMRIQRQAQYEGDTNQFPLFPGVRVSQNGVAFDDPGFRDFVRLPVEPNTVISTTYVDDPIVNSTTYVLEYLPSSISNTQNFNNAFNARFDNFIPGGQVFLGVPAYAPTQATYPAAFQAQPLSGYLSGNYYDPNHSGEGINIEVDELSSGLRTLFFAWFTYDDLGFPYWISGSNVFNTGDTYVNVPTGYGSNGGFAGAFGAKAPQTLWGNVAFVFADCNHVNMQYASVSGLPAHTPSGNGVLNWQRLTTLNGLTCE